VRERLARLEEVVSHLADLRQLDREQVRRSIRDRWAIERGLQMGAEIVFDIGNHVLSAHFGRTAQDYEDIIAQLHDAGVLGDATRDRLKGLGGFRNLLVHGYVRLDGDRVVDYLTEAPARLSAFSVDVSTWLDQVVTGGK
jgi:uncharacterized protein YutE (UPF0331/DUF86 family)